MTEPTWDYDAPLLALPDESAKASQALNDYALFGPGRSFVKLLDRYQNAPKACPTSRLQTLKEWSSRFFWQARVARYDSQVAEREQREYEARWVARREAEREETWQLAQELRAKAKKMLDFPLMDVEQITAQRHGPGGVQHLDMTVVKPARWSLRDVATMAESAAKLARLSADLPTERLAIEDLTPRDLEAMSKDQLLLLKEQLARGRRH